MPQQKYYYDEIDHFHNKCLGWELKFALLPKYCILSGKKIWLKFGYKGTAMHFGPGKIWLKFGYKGTAMHFGPGDPVFEHHWHDKNEHIVWKLKR
jgi:hypothetical protein